VVHGRGGLAHPRDLGYLDLAGTLLGRLFGWMLYEGKVLGDGGLAAFLDVFRSVPLIIQLVLFYNLAPIIGLESGCVCLRRCRAHHLHRRAGCQCGARRHGGRRNADAAGGAQPRHELLAGMRHVVLPIGGRAVFPSWIGVALGVMKDSALVSVLGYVELLRASQILITRTQEPFLILAIAGAFYFALSYPISRYAEKLEKRWAHDDRSSQPAQKIRRSSCPEGHRPDRQQTAKSCLSSAHQARANRRLLYCINALEPINEGIC
jgi:ABC-type amino acid transport system permease subunit